MAPGAPEDPAAIFERLHPKLLRVAYRMIGSVHDAQDVVQDAFVRWMGADRSEVREPEAFIQRTVTRLCLDLLKSAKRQRETYLGPWLPDPIVDDDGDDDVTLPLMLALERLTPLERAAFLLHDVFGLSFDEIAKTIDRDVAACRQLAARARSHVREARPRFQIEKERGLEIARAFYVASRSGDMAALGKMLAADVSVHADGGGKRPAALEPVVGLAEVMKLQARLATMFAATVSKLVRVGFINGLPGFVSQEADGEYSTTALDIEEGKIAAIYVVRNPDKLKHLH
ncbi:sigma-70 family RNA polymerase sigma factor [Mesorhizobium loti]|uniref:RNA polymerase subunit sigma n=1 Tax=Rhizobium loti TaxID=381 RepID=A0A6M7UAH8_RHILI|nr:sigma-70 family RNA polymerase sigma factor [Mesorhizobium loti]OBQ62394.1 RNA polymerase subunit sigma [Mesorhizobium loti]QKC73882.1 sigma-70 family RNA polymerase sigma factor [Mesorhizobium loti]